jgi:centrosomal protein CEP104
LYNKAQPLYERALRIYEKTHGPDHPDVAHTLTDLAVLHLEQVCFLACKLASWH